MSDCAVFPFTSARRMSGVTLIELMVGMAIGLLAVLVMTQVGVVYEGHKRSTTSGSDAQVNAALALYTLQRDVRMGGYGLTSSSDALGCVIKGQRTGTPTPPATTMTLAPVIITDGATGAPDTIGVVMSSSPNYSVPIPIKQNHLRSDTTFVLKDTPNPINIGNSKGDLMLAVPTTINSNSWCAIFNVSTDPATTGNTIVHAPGADGPWNTKDVFPGTTDDYESYPSGSYLINLGKLTSREYSIGTNEVLQVQSFVSDAATSSPEELIPNVVNLQAVYGKDTNADAIVDTWNVTSPATPDEWRQVLAVRIAVVTRSTQYEKEEVTATQPSWMPDGTTATAIKVNGITDWKHYRYKTYEVVVPLRNMIWHSR